MKRTNAAGFAPGNLFTDGNPIGGIPATEVEQTWLNNVQEEIAHVVEAAGLTLDGMDTYQLLAAINLLAAPVGTTGKLNICAYSTPGSNELECNGALVSRTTFADLFAQIGTTFGAGDGSTTFQLPETRGEFLRGWDHGRGVDTGRVFGSAQSQDIQAHTHTVFAGINDTAAGAAGSDTPFLQNTSGSNNVTSASTGGTETRPRNKAFMITINI